MGLIAFIAKMTVIPVTVIADAMAITAVIAIMAVTRLESKVFSLEKLSL